MSDEPERGEEFSLYTFDENGACEHELRFVTAVQAMRWARWVCETRETIGDVTRIVITDRCGDIRFEWTLAGGISRPPSI